ncbi:ras-related protein Rab-2A-like isoform X2 [Planococcus citri]|uniref:ras-related protein Rab-2A-like isoform X2 n=1 Tax=Planococcus citri TaxID=170843 RepID=UPI0031F9119B
MGNNVNTCSSEKTPPPRDEEVTNPPFDVIMVGDITGKSCIQARFCTGIYDPARGYTVGFEVGHKKMVVDNEEIELRIYDTCNSETAYRAFQQTYEYGKRSPNGIILVYDITRESTFSNLRTTWLERIQHDFGLDVPIIVVGNKCDLESERTVKQSEVEEFCDDVPQIICAVLSSAKTNKNIEFIFTHLAIEMKK